MAVIKEDICKQIDHLFGGRQAPGLCLDYTGRKIDSSLVSLEKYYGKQDNTFKEKYGSRSYPIFLALKSRWRSCSYHFCRDLDKNKEQISYLVSDKYIGR